MDDSSFADYNHQSDIVEWKESYENYIHVDSYLTKKELFPLEVLELYTSSVNTFITSMEELFKLLKILNKYLTKLENLKLIKNILSKSDGLKGLLQIFKNEFGNLEENNTSVYKIELNQYFRLKLDLNKIIYTDQIRNGIIFNLEILNSFENIDTLSTTIIEKKLSNIFD